MERPCRDPKVSLRGRRDYALVASILYVQANRLVSIWRQPRWHESTEKWGLSLRAGGRNCADEFAGVFVVAKACAIAARACHARRQRRRPYTDAAPIISSVLGQSDVTARVMSRSNLARFAPRACIAREVRDHEEAVVISSIALQTRCFSQATMECVTASRQARLRRRAKSPPCRSAMSA